MENEREFKALVLGRLMAELKADPQVLAVWQGGSDATATADQFSDIDLCVVAKGDPEKTFARISAALNTVAPVAHLWNEPKTVWPEISQKVYFLEGAPQHFFVDAAVFPETATRMIEEFMQTERHGHAVIHHDPRGLLKPRNVDKAALGERQQKRLAEIRAAYPVYRTTTQKALDRGHSVDAIYFFQAGMVRPLVEVLGMLHRPFQFDFGFRYLGRTFPRQLFERIESFMFVQNMEELRLRMSEADQLFREAVAEAEKKVRTSPTS